MMLIGCNSGLSVFLIGGQGDGNGWVLMVVGWVVMVIGSNTLQFRKTWKLIENYQSIFNTLNSFVKDPDLLIYLRSGIPNLVDQIHKRGRDYENSISIEYLSRLNERYEAWIQSYDKSNLLVIEVDDIDFVENKEDFQSIIKKIDSKLS